MLDRAFLALAALGFLACTPVHAAALLGFPAGFAVAFALMGGCLLVWWRAVRTARATFRTVDAKSLWNAVTDHCPWWVKYAFHPLVLYFGVFWAWALYVAVVQDSKPSPKLWALFFSAGAAVFYFGSAAFLWASLRARDPASQG